MFSMIMIFYFYFLPELLKIEGISICGVVVVVVVFNMNMRVSKLNCFFFTPK